MLQELIMELVTAADEGDRDDAYERMEQMGVDRKTADEMVSYFTEGVRACA